MFAVIFFFVLVVHAWCEGPRVNEDYKCSVSARKTCQSVAVGGVVCERVEAGTTYTKCKAEKWPKFTRPFALSTIRRLESA